MRSLFIIFLFPLLTLAASGGHEEDHSSTAPTAASRPQSEEAMAEEAPKNEAATEVSVEDGERLMKSYDHVEQALKDTHPIGEEVAVP